MGFDFTVIAPLLLSHCGFSFVFGCDVSFLVSSRVFLSMIVQQLVVILVFSQEGVRARPSTPPSWFRPLHWIINLSNTFLQLRDQQTFSAKGKIVNIFGILGHMVSVTSIRLCCGGTVDNTQRTGLCSNKTLFAKPGSGPSFPNLCYD